MTIILRQSDLRKRYIFKLEGLNKKKLKILTNWYNIKIKYLHYKPLIFFKKLFLLANDHHLWNMH